MLIVKYRGGGKGKSDSAAKLKRFFAALRDNKSQFGGQMSARCIFLPYSTII
jgi:hypothetical protein